MRFYVRDNEVEVVLSRRNLETGLLKLGMDGSARELRKEGDSYVLRVRFEEDDEHYAGRQPGRVVLW